MERPDRRAVGGDLAAVVGAARGGVAAGGCARGAGARAWRLAVAVGCVQLVAAAAGAEYTPLASYEPAETDLVVTASAGDAGLSVGIVPGGVGGAPPATDGAYVLRLEIAGEADRKVEFRHHWSERTYDLAGEDALLADVFIAEAGALPGLVGIWSANWYPPDAWQPAAAAPGQTGVWTTVSFDVAGREQVGLDYLWAFVLEDLAGTSGVVYVDNLRLAHAGGAAGPVTGVAANGFEGANGIAWKPLAVAGLEGYHVYRSASAAGPFTRLNEVPTAEAVYYDPTGPGSPRYHYRVTARVGGIETAPSAVVSAQWNGMTDEALLDWIQEQTFWYFWDYGHPVSGLAREGLTHAPDICATGGTGMGLMVLVVGAERGFVTRAAAAGRVRQILAFLGESCTRYHGAWAHWVNGGTGATIPFGTYDDGGDLVETSYVAQGLLTVRQYFDRPDPVEAEIRARATALWEGIEWDWYRRYPGSNVLYWHWSPTYGWAMNMPVRGYMEAMITYLLAIASPTHPMPPAAFHDGWAGLPGYTNGGTFYGYLLPVGPDYGGPLFFTHYSFLGFDPRYKRDAYCNYFENSRTIGLIHNAYSVDNPLGFSGYSRWLWGLTASTSPPPWGYLAHSPTSDNGTIAPTAALSSMPFTPAESLAALRYLVDHYAPQVIGPYGLVDALNPELGWFSDTHLAIDQGPIVVLIENYRTGLCWKRFMANPEIRPMLRAIGMYDEVDFDFDGDVDASDFETFARCLAGPGAPRPPACTPQEFADADLDNDGDVDAVDAAIFQRLGHVP